MVSVAGSACRIADLEAEITQTNSKTVDYDAFHNLLSQIQGAISRLDADDQKALLRSMVQSILITKEAPRGVGRQITKINLLFDFTIDALQKDSATLLARLSATQQLDCIAPLEPSVLDSLNETHTDSLRDLMK